MAEKGIVIEISYLDAFTLVTFSGVFVFAYDTKEKAHQNTLQSDLCSGVTLPRTNQIASCFNALSITWSLIFQ
jgi:hypothetical protein